MERKALMDRIQGVFMIRRYTVALMQMDTQNDKGKNLETACAWIDEAAAKGAKLICFPEVMNLIGKNIGEGGGRDPGRTGKIEASGAVFCQLRKIYGISG